MTIHSELIVELIVLGLLSAFFSSSETALFSLGRAQRSQLKRMNPIFGLKVLDLLSNSTRLLALLLLCNMLINILFFSIAYKVVEPLMERQGAIWTVLAVIIPVITVIIFGEVIPKSIALQFSYKWSLVVAYPLSWIMKLMSPFLNILERFMLKPHDENRTDFKTSELEDLVDQTTQEGELERSEGGLLKDLIRFGIVRVDEVMIPRSDIVAFQLSKGADVLRGLFESTLLTKIPVYQRSLDDVVGVIYLRDFVSNLSGDLKSLIRPLPVYPEQMHLKVLYERMLLRKQKTALVVDEYGGTAGVITLKDILEEIVGEFNEELVEPESEIHWDEHGTCYISAALPIRDFEELVGHELKRGPYLTLGGYLLESFGRMPKKGEKIESEGLEFEIEHVERSRLITICIRGLKKVRPL